MKRYIKTTEQEILSASKVGDINTFEKVMRAANKQMICCISANIFTFNAIKNKEKRKEIIERFNDDISEYNLWATKSLHDVLTDSKYNYFETFGGWIDPETGISTQESSFIVLGPEYDKKYFGTSTEELLEDFRNYFIELCGEYHQWAVLIIDSAEDIDNTVSGHSMDIRKDLYKKFYEDKKYMTDEYRYNIETDEDAEIEYKTVREDLNNDKFKDVNLYSLHGTYYDDTGHIVKEYHNVTSNVIGQFFTTLARKQGADKFTLLASSNFYVPFIYTCQGSWHREHSLEEIYAQRQTDYYKKYAQDILDNM